MTRARVSIVAKDRGTQRQLVCFSATQLGVLFSFLAPAISRKTRADWMICNGNSSSSSSSSGGGGGGGGRGSSGSSSSSSSSSSSTDGGGGGGSSRSSSCGGSSTQAGQPKLPPLRSGQTIVMRTPAIVISASTHVSCSFSMARRYGAVLFRSTAIVSTKIVQT